MAAAKICCPKIAVGLNQKLFGAPNEKQNGESGRAIVDDWFEFFVKNFDLDRGVMIDFASTPQKREIKTSKLGQLAHHISEQYRWVKRIILV